MASREKTMKYLAGVLLLSSCAMLGPAPVADRPAETQGSMANPEANPEANPDPSQNQPDARKPKLKSPPVPPTEVSSCANLDAGDLKATIKAKLDCITERAK
jgi:hypothetical protein